MRPLLKPLMVVSLVAFPAALHAQYWRGSVFVAPTGWSESRAIPGRITESATSFSWEFGAGLERLLLGGIGIGADIEGVSPGPQRFSDAAGFASLGGFYHFRRQRPLDPFVTAGYAVSVPSSSAKTIACGGGINYWLNRRVGVLLEFREYLPAFSEEGHSFHVSTVRLGFVIR